MGSGKTTYIFTHTRLVSGNKISRKISKNVQIVSRCWSYIGRQNKRQQLSLQRPTEKDCKCFCSPGLAMHEIMHALGFYHEHARSDRDKYVKIIRKNVRKGLHQNFEFQNDDKSTRNFNYDYDSLMHYGPYSFRYLISLESMP